MARFGGNVGYAEIVEVRPGVHEEAFVERPYRGDVQRKSRRLEIGDDINSESVVSQTVSIVADAYAYENFMNIRYLVWMGDKWKVNNVDVERPRLVMTIGAKYNA